jgi:Flp pilus assembly protein TadG
MPNHKLRKQRRERGFVLHMWTFMMIFIIIPMVGLAIDCGVLYTIKGKLQTAVDGAALGAARSLSRGISISDQEDKGTDAATRYYHANFPDTWMGVTPVNDPTVDWSHSTATTAVIDVTGSVNAPTWFMRILGFNSVHLNVMSESVRRNVNIMLVIDRSTSLALAGNCAPLITAAQTFVNAFANNRDQMAMVTFGSYYNLDFDFNTVFRPALSDQIGNLNCQGTTNGSGGFARAWARLNLLADVGSLNVILFFTDGQPNTVTFGPAYGNGSGLGITAKTSAGCLSVGGNGFSGAINGDTSGFQYGIMRATNSTYPAPANDWSAPGNVIGASQGWSSGCQFRANSANYYNDITAIPSTDAWGNSVNSTWVGGNANGFPYSVTLTNVTSAGAVQTTLDHAGINALDNAAQQARVQAAAAGIPLIVYSIGLGSVNDPLLARVANAASYTSGGTTTTVSTHQSSYTTGKYIPSPTSANLTAAFAEIASDILRIAK